MHEEDIARSREARSRVLRRWRPPDASRRREQVAVALNFIPLVVGALGLAFVAPPSDWSDPALIFALAGISAVAYTAEERLKVASRVFFGAGLVIAMVALAVAGPLPALLVWLVPDLIARFVLRSEHRLSPGFVANLGSYALAVWVGAEVLLLGGAPHGTAIAPTLYATGLAIWAVNFCFARLTFAPFYQGYRPLALIRDEFFDLAPAVLGMTIVGIGAAVAVEYFGVFALAVLAAAIVIPQIALQRIAHTESASRLAHADALRLYTAAISDVLELPRQERRELACAADIVHSAGDPITARGLDWRDADVSRIAFLALHSHERWSGSGWPAGLPAEAIPRGSRILAVAAAWAELTAAGTLELSQSEAILSLSVESGSAFDPAVVEAAVRVVGDEQGFASEPGFQPKLHRLPVPRSLRRGALPAMLPRIVGSAG